MIGKVLSPTLIDMEAKIFVFEAATDFTELPNFSDEGFRAALKIFITALSERIYVLQDAENMPFVDRLSMIKKANEELNHFIKVYADTDTEKMYK